MILTISQTRKGEFSTRNQAGALAAASATAGVLVVNGVDTAATVTITTAITGIYKASASLAGLSVGDQCWIRITVTCDGVEDSGCLPEFQVGPLAVDASADLLEYLFGRQGRYFDPKRGPASNYTLSLHELYDLIRSRVQAGGTVYRVRAGDTLATAVAGKGQYSVFLLEAATYACAALAFPADSVVACLSGTCTLDGGAGGSIGSAARGAFFGLRLLGVDQAPSQDQEYYSCAFVGAARGVHASNSNWRAWACTFEGEEIGISVTGGSASNVELYGCTATATPASDHASYGVYWSPGAGSSLRMYGGEASSSVYPEGGGNAYGVYGAAELYGVATSAPNGHSGATEYASADSDPLRYLLGQVDGTAIESRLNATVVGRIDANISSRSTYAGGDTAGTTTLLSRLTALRAGYMDALSTGVALSEAAQAAVVAAIETELANDATGGALMQSIADKLTATFDLEDLSLAAIGNAARDAILNRILAGNHDGAGTAGLLLQKLNVAGTLANTDNAASFKATGFSTLTEANVRTAIGLAAANLDTQLADLPTVAEFEARTLASSAYATASNLASLALQFTGITSLANWLRAGFRKSTPDATALSEINSGGGSYSGTTDSQEAIRDRGDAAWTTGAGGEGGTGTVNVLPISSTLQPGQFSSLGASVLPISIGQHVAVIVQWGIFESDGTTGVPLDGKTLRFVIHDSTGKILHQIDADAITIADNDVTVAITAAHTARAGTWLYKLRNITDGNQILASGEFKVLLAPAGS